MLSRTVPTQYLTTVSIHRWRLAGYMSFCLLHSVGICAVRRWRRLPDGYAMLLISVVGYMLYEKPRWYTHWRLVDVYMLGLQPVPDKLATVQGRQAITRLQEKLQTTLFRCSFARYRERQNLAIFKFRWISVESSVFVSLWMPCRFSLVSVDVSQIANDFRLSF